MSTEVEAQPSLRVIATKLSVLVVIFAVAVAVILANVLPLLEKEIETSGSNGPVVQHDIGVWKTCVTVVSSAGGQGGGSSSEGPSVCGSNPYSTAVSGYSDPTCKGRSLTFLDVVRACIVITVILTCLAFSQVLLELLSKTLSRLAAVVLSAAAAVFCLLSWTLTLAFFHVSHCDEKNTSFAAEGYALGPSFGLQVFAWVLLCGLAGFLIYRLHFASDIFGAPLEEDEIDALDGVGGSYGSHVSVSRDLSTSSSHLLGNSKGSVNSSRVAQGPRSSRKATMSYLGDELRETPSQDPLPSARSYSEAPCSSRVFPTSDDSHGHPHQ